MKRFLISLTLAFSCAFAYTPEFKEYNSMLNQTVCNSGVDYKKIVKLDLMKTAKKNFDLTHTQFKKLPENERLAYLINAYNYYTIELILNHYPTKSIRDLKKPWKRKFISLFTDGVVVSLDEIEHEWIRKNFDEPRIHFAVVCASIGCPELRNEAFTASMLHKQLDEQALAFLMDKSKNRIEDDELMLSKIFKWYGDDFKNKYGGYIPYVQKILKTKHDDVEWLDYDWNLNEQQCK